MLFRNIQIKDFLTFKGANTFEFPKAEKTEHALMLILAPNTAGKTNTIRALRFLFHGDLLGHDSDAHKLINDAATAELQPGDSISAWVQVKILYLDRERTIRRRIDANCLRPGVLSSKPSVLEEQKHERQGDVFVSDQGEIQRALNLMIPPDLFDYFFFEGESLAEKLVGGKSIQGIKEGLATLIHDHQWETALQAVRDVEKKIGKDLKNISDKDQEYKELVSRVDKVNQETGNLNLEKVDLDEKHSKAEVIYEESEQAIRDLSQGKSFEKLNKDLESARLERKEKERLINELDLEISRLIGNSQGLPFLGDAFGDALNQLEQMRDLNLLPADVSEPFANRLLDWPKTKICICGRGLDPKLHSDQRQCIEDYRERSMSVDLSAALLDLLNSLEKDAKHGFSRRSQESCSVLTDSLSKRDAAVIASIDLKERVKALEDERQNNNVEAVQKHQKRQREAGEIMGRIKIRLEKINELLQSLRHQKTKLDGDVKTMAGQGANSRIISMLKEQEQAKQLAEFIGEARAAVKGAFHTKLQDLVSQYYDPVAPDKSVAHVDRATLLPSIRVDGEVRRNIGGAQRQLLVLSHIVSLAQLRKWLHDELLALKIAPGRIDEHCFVLDSVFGPTADEFREKCAEFLVGKARQVIILVASQQWDETVRSRLEGYANKAYRLIRCTTKENMKPEDRTMEFRGKAYEVFRQIDGKQKPYTVAEEIL